MTARAPAPAYAGAEARARDVLASLLELADANPYSARAYRRAAETIRGTQLSALVQRTLDDLRDPFYRRNFLSHQEPVTAGQLEIRFEPGRRAEITLVDRSEQGPEVGSLRPDEPRLGPLLEHQLWLVEERIFDFIGPLPEAPAAQC
jgi:hypothetical protein